MTPELRDDRVLLLTRVSATVIAVVLAAAGLTLTVFPADTDRFFAWPIKPEMTPLFMGSGYLLGSYFWARAIFARRWHHVGAVLLPIGFFASLMLIATVIHWDRFNHTHPWFYIWVAVYVIAPFLIPYLWLRNRRTDPGTPDPDDLPMPVALRLFLVVAGTAELVLGLALFVVPEAFVADWPWALTPLTGRVVGGWYAVAGLTAVMVSRDPRWSTSRILFQGSVGWLLLLLLGAVRGWADLDKENPLSWVYVASLILFLAVAAGFYVSLEARRGRLGAVSAAP